MAYVVMAYIVMAYVVMTYIAIGAPTFAVAFHFRLDEVFDIINEAIDRLCEPSHYLQPYPSVDIVVTGVLLLTRM